MAELRERLVFDGASGRVLDGPRRYLLMRPDVLMGMFVRLAPAERQHAFEAFARSIAEHGADSIRAYFESTGRDVEALLEVTAGAAADLGWGRWMFERPAGSLPDRLRLSVHDSPFAAGYGSSSEPVCAPLRGMLCAVAAVAFGAAFDARELRCASQGAPCCEFEAIRCAPHDERRATTSSHCTSARP